MMGLIVFDKLLNRKDNITPIGLTRKSSLKNLDILTFTIDNSNKLEKYDRVLVKDLKLKWKEFVVTSIDCVHNNDATSQIYCEDAMGELRNYFITEKRSRDESCNRALEKVLEGTGWDFETDSTVTGLGITSYYRISVLEALDKISETWGVEIDSEIEINQNGISKRLITVSKKLGDDTGKRFSFGKDILSITRTVDESEVITALYGFGASLQIENESEDDKESGYTRKIDFSEINNGKAYVENLTAKNEYGIRGVDGTIYHRFGQVSFDNIEDKVELKRLTEEKLVELSKPTITYETTVADLSVAGYILEGVGKGDTVKIRDKDLDLALEARVLELTHKYDENEIEITLGTYKNLYGSDIMSVSEIVRRLADKENIYDRSRFFNEDGTNFSKFETILEDINNRFESGTTNITFDENGGITFTDKSTDEESSWAMNLSSYGLRIANTKHANGTWNYNTAITGKGIVGSTIISNSITVNQLAADVGKELDISSNSAITSRVSKTEILTDPEIQEALKGEDAVTVHIDSVSGNIFKNSSIATTLVVSIIEGEDWIQNSTDLKKKYGNTAHIQWREKKFGTLTYVDLSDSDSRLSDNGFLLTVSANDIETKSTFKCDLEIGE